MNRAIIIGIVILGVDVIFTLSLCRVARRLDDCATMIRKLYLDQLYDRGRGSFTSPSNTDRCIVCGHAAAVVITVDASIIGKGSGRNIVSNRVFFCDEHGMLRYGDSLRALQGGLQRLQTGPQR